VASISTSIAAGIAAESGSTHSNFSESMHLTLDLDHTPGTA